jgi:Apea-like HEPN
MTIDEAPDQPPQFSALRHYVPLGVAFPSKLGFSTCRIAPGLEIRGCSDADRRLLRRVNEESSSVIALMHVVPIRHESHVICIDEQAYGQYIGEKIVRELKRPVRPFAWAFNVSDIFKMIVVSLNLFQLFPLYRTPYCITERRDIDHVYPSPLNTGTEITWETWQRYGPSGHDITSGGVITCGDITNAVNVLEKYYRFDGWVGNRVAVALHNFWNALFVTDSTLSFVALVSILETFSNLSKSATDPVMDQIRRNVPKLVPLDAHGRTVTVERIDKIYDTRSEIAHGSFGHEGHGIVTWTVTHIDAKSAHVDVSLSSELMSIAVKMLHRVLFDQTLLSIIENAETRDQERRGIRSYVDALPH